MSRIAFIYPGQGAQTCGMGREFYEQTRTGREIFDLASGLLGFSVPELCFTENDRLNNTAYTQAAMVTVGIAMTKVLLERGVKPDVTAGLSLGQYCALYTAGVMSAADAIQTVRRRGIFMQEAVPAGEGAMAAVLAMDAAQIEAVLADMDGVQIANYNCPGQIVISGRTGAVDDACERLKAAGAKRTVRLNVSGPFHSRLMAGAGEKLGEVLEQVKFSEPEIPVVSNVTGTCVTDAGQLRKLLVEQVSSSVRWEQSIRTMIADGVDTFVEIGPGKTLSGFMRKIDRSRTTMNVEKPADVDAVAAALAGNHQEEN